MSRIIQTGVAAVLIMAGGMSVQDVYAENEGKLRHMVVFKYKDSATQEEIAAIESAFAALPEKIDAIIDFEMGKNISKEGHDQGFTHCYLVTFENKKGLEAYLPHPDHQTFVELLKPSLEKVFVVDFIAN